jgi:hypothetical protein
MPLIISFIPVSACRPVTRRRESPGILGEEERDARASGVGRGDIDGGARLDHGRPVLS